MMMPMKRLLLLLTIGTVPMFAGDKPLPVMVPESRTPFNSSAPEQFEGKPELELNPQAPGARVGKIYLRKNAQGLIISGTVIGDQPRFARSAADIMEKEHLEVWLATTPDPDLPAIGWTTSLMMLSCRKEKRPAMTSQKRPRAKVLQQ
jgi:hypothetical protein